MSGTVEAQTATAVLSSCSLSLHASDLHHVHIKKTLEDICDAELQRRFASCMM